MLYVLEQWEGMSLKGLETNVGFNTNSVAYFMYMKAIAYLC